MQKPEIDYSNTIIYKIFCNDPLIKEVYVGHTTNFVQRKIAHKLTCNNINSSSYNLKLYKTIREHGNWSNWTMTIVNFYDCKNSLEARQKEQEHFVSLGATLNSVEPFPQNKKKFDCLNNEVEEEKTNITDFNTDSKRFYCSVCNYNTERKNDYNKHVLTPKHILSNKKIIQTNKNSKLHKCLHCEKMYNHKSSLCKHKLKCKDNPSKIKQTLVIELLMQNQELQKTLIGLYKEKIITDQCV